MSLRRSFPVAFVQGSSQAGSASSFTSLSPEIQDQMVQRVGGLGFVYALAWIANYVFYTFFHDAVDSGVPKLIWDVLTLVGVTVGTTVFVVCRRRLVPGNAFLTLAIGFQVLGAVGIYAGMLQWTVNGAALVANVGEALGIAEASLRSGLVDPIHESGYRLLYLDGLTWVANWLLLYPLVVPMPLVPQVVGTVLTASVVPVVLYLGTVLHGVPDTIEPWVLPYAIEATVPTFIVAGIALLASRVVYGLTRDLSRAQRLGHYELVEMIGAGGMGQVWRAKHQLLVRPAAVKLIRPELLGDDPAAARVAIARFEREVQLAARLHHPHTITIYDYGRTDDGIFYYVMELLDGLNLDEFVRRFGPVPAERAVHWLRQACASLHEAHGAGLIHRDVKPANLFVCRYGLEADFLKVLDFGLVKNRESTDGGDFDTRMTKVSEAPGTPAFMAPEVGLGHDVDGRSDLYALACVAYWLLTGTTVFEGSTAMDVLVKHAREDPLPPSRRTELSIPGDLEEIVLACLAKDPDDRPASAWELERRLAACSAAEGWTPDRRDAWWDLHVPAAAPS